MYETWFRCIDWNCPKYNIKDHVSRENFRHHVELIPTERLREIITIYNIVEFPDALNRFTLVNLVIDYSKEPLASELIKKYPVVT